MKTKTSLFMGPIFLMASLSQSFAIEGLTISIQNGTNIVLGWPSATNESYIVQYRAAWDTNNPWQSLTNYYPAFAGTNWTTFVITNAVPPASGGGGGGGGGGNIVPSPDGADLMAASSLSASSLSDSDRATIRRRRIAESANLLPPVPWDPSTWTNAATMSISSPAGRATPNSPSGSPDDSPTGSSGDPGFFRVVREGLHLVGITNGSVLSGIVAAPVEVGYDDSTVSLSAVTFDLDTNTQSAIQGLSVGVSTNGCPEMDWNTYLMSNGTYQLNLGAQFGEDTQVSTAPIYVTVSNAISFPNAWNVAGFLILIQAQTVFTNGTYNVTLIDDQGATVLSLNGTNDATGAICYGGHPGFTVANYDQYGNQYPSLYYNEVVTAYAAGTNTSTIITNTIIAETPWPVSTGGSTQWAIDYMPIYGTTGGLNSLVLQAMIENIYLAVENRYLGVVRGTDQNPTTLSSQNDFNTLLASDLRQDAVRNFYYFGHGGPNILGSLQSSAPNGSFTAANVQIALKNNYPATNAHPYRFVFLDGCKTASGTFPIAFGIPNQANVPTNFFISRGVRNRAFMGWDNSITIGFANSPNVTHIGFIGYFFQRWQGYDNTNNVPFSVADAVQFAATYGGTAPAWSQAQHLIIYGFGGLHWDDSIP